MAIFTCFTYKMHGILMVTAMGSRWQEGKLRRALDPGVKIILIRPSKTIVLTTAIAVVQRIGVRCTIASYKYRPRLPVAGQ